MGQKCPKRLRLPASAGRQKYLRAHGQDRAKSGHCGRACRKGQPTQYHAAMLVSKAFVTAKRASHPRIAASNCSVNHGEFTSCCLEDLSTALRRLLLHQKQRADPKVGPLGLYMLSRHAEAPSPQRRKAGGFLVEPGRAASCPNVKWFTYSARNYWYSTLGLGAFPGRAFGCECGLLQLK